MATLDSFKNFAIANVTGTYDASQTSITVASGEGARFPASNFSLVWWNDTTYPGAPWNDPNREIVRCSSRTNDTLTIDRGQEQADGGLPASTKNTPGVQYKVSQAITVLFRNTIEQKSIDIGAQTVYVTEDVVAGDGIVGAKGDGVTDDTAAINAAITAGNLVIFPPGTYLVNGALALKSSLVIEGAGPGLTTVKLKNSATQANIFSSSASLAACTIRGLTIDGNETNNTSNGLGIQIHGCTSLWIENVEITGCRLNGITLGTSTTVQNAQVRNCRIKSCHGHLLEVQNRGSTNLGNVIEACNFDTPGLSETTVQGGIVVRGAIRISDCDVQGVATNTVGILLEDDDGTLGNGAHGALVVNCRVKGTSHATNVTIGLLNQAKRIRATNVEVEGTDIGFQSDATQGDDAVFTGCSAIGCGDRSWKLGGDRNTLEGYHLEGTTTIGLETLSGAIDTSLVHCRFVGTFTTAKVSEAGVSERVHATRNPGWKTEAQIEGADIANDSTGNTWYGGTVAHGLDVTPDEIQCNVSLRYDSEPTQPATIRGPYVISTDGTNVTLRIWVTAGSTTGFNFRIVCHVNARP